jgi:hypothetical protein
MSEDTLFVFAVLPYLLFGNGKPLWSPGSGMLSALKEQNIILDLFDTKAAKLASLMWCEKMTKWPRMASGC